MLSVNQTDRSIEAPQMETKFQLKHAQDHYQKITPLEAGCQKYEFYFNYCGIRIGKSIIDEATQVIVFESVRRRIW